MHQFWFAEFLEEIWVVIQKASRSFRQLGRNSSHICTARLEVCRPMVKRSIICCRILGNN